MIINRFFAAFVFTIGVVGAALTMPVAAAVSPDKMWSDVAESAIERRGQRLIQPARYRTVRLAPDRLTAMLGSAPTERAGAPGVVVSLPMPNGGFQRFSIVESPVMSPELGARYPQIKTYRGVGLDDATAYARLDRTPAGFHALIRSVSGSVYIDPYQFEGASISRRGGHEEYVVYERSAYNRDVGEAFQCGVQNENHGTASPGNVIHGAAPVRVPSGAELRIYRTAIAATGEYTAFHGGTGPAGLAAIVTTLNRVNVVYERDVAIRMVLVPGNSQIIYTSTNDPYSNGSGGTMLGQNQTNLDTVIGNANYDIGHVFSTGGGGVASLGVPCRTGRKARGVTGLDSPIGDPFDIDYVAHEMGHQWGANHTFNGNENACSGGNRSGSNAYEPGSGSTIMAYAGICGAQDLQRNSDDHFHSNSIDEMVAYTQSGSGSACPEIIPAGNNPPTADAGAGGFTLPVDTPFELTGSATDVDGDTLTYNWEQFDLGPAGSPFTPSANAPLFRSFPSAQTPSRTFPRLADLLANTQTIGELLPGYSRDLTFRLTVRDNNPDSGGVDHDTISLSVSSAAGPFQVTSPNTAVSWQGGSTEQVTWNVANTQFAPVSCASVNIMLSSDGGLTYPLVLAAAAPNDGSASVVVPQVNSGSARLKLACADNVFFDISDADFELTAAPADSDGDGISDTLDNCTLVANADQRDTNGDGYGNVCDPDLDGDEIINFSDLGLMKSVFFSNDADADFDGNGAVDFLDLGVLKSYFFGVPGPSGVAP